MGVVIILAKLVIIPTIFIQNQMVISMYVVLILLLFLFCRRELFPDGILYVSRESHYSIFKAAKMYRMKCTILESLCSGEIDCSDLEEKLILNKDKAAIIVANIGITAIQFVY